MPKREDLKSIMIIGSGPIIIGQACEFDYSGTQACKVLKALGYRVILLNSNPATIMTDPDLADVTYIEPLTVEFASQVIEKEKPDALLERYVVRLHATRNGHTGGVISRAVYAKTTGDLFERAGEVVLGFVEFSDSSESCNIRTYG